MSSQHCKHNLVITKFRIHFTSHKINFYYNTTFLGFVIDSVPMTLKIKVGKKNKVHNLCLEILQKEKISLRTLASAIGNFVASYGPFGTTF